MPQIGLYLQYIYGAKVAYMSEFNLSPTVYKINVKPHNQIKAGESNSSKVKHLVYSTTIFVTIN